MDVTKILMMLWVPCVSLVPPHAPEAVQPEAPLVDQVRSVVPPEVTEVGLAEKVIVGPVEVTAVTFTEALC